MTGTLAARWRAAAVALGAAATLVPAGCEWGGRAYWLGKYDGQIAAATRALAAADSDAARAQAHLDRGAGYSEKARYSRAFKIIPPGEYVRLYDLAIADLDLAVALAPGDTRVYLGRGMAVYNRAALESAADPGTRRLFDAAAADFTRAVERDPTNAEAYDMRGLVHTTGGELDLAIRDFTEVMRIDPHLGKLRLAEAHCSRAGVLAQAGKLAAAIADYERSIEFDPPADGCDCQPDSPLAWLYLETGQLDKARDAVRRARRAGRWVAPEVIERLGKASRGGR